MKYLSYLLPLILGALIMWAVLPTNTDKAELIKQKALNQHRMDSVAQIILRLKEREAYWILTDKIRRDSFNIALNRLKTYQHDHQKPVPIVRYSVPELDSVISKIIGR